MKITRIACAMTILTGAFGEAYAGWFQPVFDIPGSDPFSTSPLALDDIGHYGGFYTTGGGAIQHGYIGLINGGWQTIDYVTPDFTTVATEIRGINCAQETVGIATTSLLNFTSQGTREFSRNLIGGITTLTDPRSGLPFGGVAQGINCNGEIVGDSRDTYGNFLFGFILSPIIPGGITILSDPAAPLHTHPRGINNSGVVVGFYRDANVVAHGFLYDPGSRTYTTLDNPLAFYGVPTGNNDAGTILTAINNAVPSSSGPVGQIAGQYVDASGHIHAFVIDATHTEFTEIRAPGSVNTQTFGIDDNGRITVNSDSGSFIWSPGPLGNPYDVYLPLTTVNGAFQFQLGVSPNVTYYIDPKIARGYDYRIGTGNPNFAAVTPPSVGGGKFEVWVCSRSHHCTDTGVVATGGSSFSFLANGWPTGVSEFKLVGIASSAKISPNDQTAFITGVDFVAGGHFTGTMTPLCGDDGGSDLQACAEE